MHADAFDRFHPAESRLHRLNPSVKVALTVAFIISNALLPDAAWLAFAAAWLFLLAANDQSRLGLWFTFRRSLLAAPFALAALSAIFSPLGGALVSFHLLWLNLTVTDVGLLRFASILIRSWLSVQMAVLLVATTQFPDILHALEHLRVPKALTTIIAFLYRYLFVLTDKVFRLLRAREARSAGLPGQKRGGSLLWRANVAGNMAGQLFVRSYERSDRIYNAMAARGYTGQLRTLHPHEIKPSDWNFLTLALILLALIQLTGWIR
ncbi:MAG: cobalt ECF transporter T component CbiQ [Anaerolineae bacterium CG_4_9_14_3_um_filter_57_17]|nr:cobalt ECF transporter T component CbiQ [bacterium]NCT20081.1 cobalt ECF transporter T component CbiQ [bacterium]PJB67098.1 MAG: cobalt ECF transporter T component CbiQ [Anaerolineae bacterium CG_4_9_14_3_um_filter_57_17]